MSIYTRRACIWMYFPYLVGDTFLTAAVPVTPRYFPALPTDLRVPLVIPAAAPRTLPAAARPWETAEGGEETRLR